jgi:hypothetical protein
VIFGAVMVAGAGAAALTHGGPRTPAQPPAPVHIYGQVAAPQRRIRAGASASAATAIALRWTRGWERVSSCRSPGAGSVRAMLGLSGGLQLAVQQAA